MKIYIVIPAHNEEAHIGTTLQSLVDQSLRPEKIVVVNDQSTDATSEIVSSFAEKHPFISLISITSNEAHLPGSKVIKAFSEGLKMLDDDYDILCKFDADLYFPTNYLEEIVKHFDESKEIGIAGGFCTIQNEENWVLENLTNKDHIRGALKAYRKACFNDIGGLLPSMGWDTADELLAQFHGWKIKTNPDLLVKHLKPTGSNYNKNSKYKQGEAFYKLRYGKILTLLASAKLAYRKKDVNLLFDYIKGYLRAEKQKLPFLLSPKEGKFSRKLRWKKILKKLF